MTNEVIKKVETYAHVLHTLECTNVCFWYVPERLQPRNFPQYGTSDWMRELGKVTAQIKSRMMTAGKLIILLGR